VAINPTDLENIFSLSNSSNGSLLAGVSFDGGLTWSARNLATGADGLVSACCDGSATFGQFGNLFISYINSSVNNVVVGMSTDGGRTFGQIASFPGSIDQPTITSGPGASGGGSVWVTYNLSTNALSQQVSRGASVTGLGSVGAFGATQVATDSG